MIALDLGSEMKRMCTLVLLGAPTAVSCSSILNLFSFLIVLQEQRFGLSKRRIAIPYDGFSQVHLMELVNKCWRPRPWLLLVVHFTTLALPGHWIFSRLKISLNEGHMSQFLELLQTSNEIYYYPYYPLVEIGCFFSSSAGPGSSQIQTGHPSVFGMALL